MLIIRRSKLYYTASGSRGVRISGSNAGYTMFRGSMKSTGYPLHSPVSPSSPLPCVTVCHHISTGLYRLWNSSLYCLLQYPFTSSLLGPNIFLTTLFSSTLSLCPFLNVTVKASRAYNNYLTTDRENGPHWRVFTLTYVIDIYRSPLCACFTQGFCTITYSE